MLDASDHLSGLVHILRHSAQPVTNLQEEVCLEMESIITALRQQLVSLQSTLTHECSLIDQMQINVSKSNDIRKCKTVWIKTLYTRLKNYIQRWELRVTANILHYIDTKLYSTIFLENAENSKFCNPIDANSNNISIVKKNLEQFQSSLLNVKRHIMIDPILLRHVATNVLLSNVPSRNTDFSSPPGLPRSRLDSSNNVQSQQQQQQKQQFNPTEYNVDQYFLDISCAKSLLEAINIFCSQDRTRRQEALVYASLLIAPPGYGKTYICNQIEKEFGPMGKEITKDVIGR
jgi:hypothetical protein